MVLALFKLKDWDLSEDVAQEKKKHTNLQSSSAVNSDPPSWIHSTCPWTQTFLFSCIRSW